MKGKGEECRWEIVRYFRWRELELFWSCFNYRFEVMAAEHTFLDISFSLCIYLYFRMITYLFILPYCMYIDHFEYVNYYYPGLENGVTFYFRT